MVHSSMYYRALIGLSLAAFAPRPLLGQSPDNALTPGLSPIQAHVNTIKLSSRLRLQTATDRMEGRLLFRTADSLGLRGIEGNESRLPLAAVDGMWTRRHHTLLGLLIGTAAGAGAYFLITRGEDDGSDTQELDQAIGTGVWVGSALVGTVVGRLIPGWKRVHP